MHINMKAVQKTLTGFPKLILGFIVIALGIQLTLKANMGMNPWGTFHQGVSMIAPISFGQVTQITGFVIIIFSLFIKIYPGIGTILNMLLIGFIVDFIEGLAFIPMADGLFYRTIYLLIGTFLFNYGVYVYLSCELGAGPRDGLLVGLVKITGAKVSYVRPSIELTVLSIGILMGGTFGVGTILNAVAGGYILNTIFERNNFNPKTTKQMVITDYIQSPSV